MESEQQQRSDQLNDRLTVESMMQVKSRKTGKKTDVRNLLGIKPEDIKDENLRSQLDSIAFNPSVAGDLIEYDTGKFDDNESVIASGESERENTWEKSINKS